MRISELLDYSISFNSKTVTISFTGSIETFNSGDTFDIVKTVIEDNKKLDIIFNLKDLHYVSSTGIGMFLNVMKIYSSKNIGLKMWVQFMQAVKVVHILVIF